MQIHFHKLATVHVLERLGAILPISRKLTSPANEKEIIELENDQNDKF